MKAKDFRIVEYMGKFTIERRYESHIGFFKKTPIMRWKSIDIIGAVFSYPSLQIPLPSFDSFDKARKVILSILKGRVVHDIDTPKRDCEQ